jgi:hypothetical protein
MNKTFSEGATSKGFLTPVTKKVALSYRNGKDRATFKNYSRDNLSYRFGLTAKEAV